MNTLWVEEDVQNSERVSSEGIYLIDLSKQIQSSGHLGCSAPLSWSWAWLSWEMEASGGTNDPGENSQSFDFWRIPHILLLTEDQDQQE